MKNVIIYWTSVVSCSVVIGATTLPGAVIQLFLHFPVFVLDLILRGQLKIFLFYIFLFCSSSIWTEKGHIGKK